MTHVKAMIAKVSEDCTLGGRPYIRCELKPGGTAWCWLPELFETIKLRSGMRAMVGVEPSEDEDPQTGLPYLHIKEIK